MCSLRNKILNMQGRNYWLDVAKGITIILMVLGHSSIPDGLSRFIYAFHMPLFLYPRGGLLILPNTI